MEAAAAAAGASLARLQLIDVEHSHEAAARACAAALCEMAARGQIVGGLLDGPLALTTPSPRKPLRRRASEPRSPAEPTSSSSLNIEAGNMLAKQMFHLSNAQSAGVVIGARAPIILTSRSDPEASDLVFAHHSGEPAQADQICPMTAPHG